MAMSLVFIGCSGLFLEVYRALLQIFKGCFEKTYGSCGFCARIWVYSAPRALRQQDAPRPVICPTNTYSGSGLILGWGMYDTNHQHAMLLFVFVSTFQFCF